MSVTAEIVPLDMAVFLPMPPPGVDLYLPLRRLVRTDS
jgi:hypothetical protein